MALFLISYDLDRPGQTWPAVDKRMERLGAQRVLASQWILTSDTTAGDLYDSAVAGPSPFDLNDRLLVVQVSDWASYNPLVPLPAV